MSKSLAALWPAVPPRDQISYISNSLNYGAGKVCAAYAGLPKVPSEIRGCWTHGWAPEFFCKIDPEFAFGDKLSKGGLHWVGTRCLESFLRDSGFHAKAIGLPIVYLPPATYERKPGSLLVMPAHSLGWTKHAWKFDDYARQIADLKSDFTDVRVCLHASCIKNGYWVKEFQQAGIPIIEGADALDANSLERMRALLSQFEYVTTNGFGSHIAYAAAFGAKLSVFGDFSSYEIEDFSDDYFYCSKPGMLRKVIGLCSEDNIRSELPEMFCHPTEAKQRTAWGLTQIGFENRISPREMRRCFGWEWHQRAYESAMKKASLHTELVMNRLLPRRMRNAMEEMRDRDFRNRNSEARRLKTYPSNAAGQATLDGSVYHFADASAFLEEYQHVFEEGAVDFPCTDESPLIVDQMPGGGLALRFWARKFPSPEIHISVVSGPARPSLDANIALADNAKVVVHDKADDLGSLPDREIDFLRFDCRSAVSEVPAEQVLRRTRRLLIECRTVLGQEQKLSRVLSLLERCGFRYHISAPRASANPLISLCSQEHADCLVKVWGYRGARFPRTWPLPGAERAAG